jgi:hypothetical protein
MTAFEVSQFPDRQLDEMAILQIEGVFDWLQLLNRETTSAHIEAGRHIVIRATANSKKKIVTAAAPDGNGLRINRCQNNQCIDRSCKP